jgi:hypothetical protein
LRGLIERFGETGPERTLGIIGFLAVTAGLLALLLDLDQALFVTAWVIAVPAIVIWNVLVLIRGRKSRPSGGDSHP